jgi:hypothetical protein
VKASLGKEELPSNGAYGVCAVLSPIALFIRSFVEQALSIDDLKHIFFGDRSNRGDDGTGMLLAHQTIEHAPRSGSTAGKEEPREVPNQQPRSLDQPRVMSARFTNAKRASSDGSQLRPPTPSAMTAVAIAGPVSQSLPSPQSNAASTPSAAPLSQRPASASAVPSSSPTFATPMAVARAPSSAPAALAPVPATRAPDVKPVVTKVPPQQPAVVARRSLQPTQPTAASPTVQSSPSFSAPAPVAAAPAAYVLPPAVAAVAAPVATPVAAQPAVVPAVPALAPSAAPVVSAQQPQPMEVSQNLPVVTVKQEPARRGRRRPLQEAQLNPQEPAVKTEPGLNDEAAKAGLAGGRSLRRRTDVKAKNADFAYD